MHYTSPHDLNQNCPWCSLSCLQQLTPKPQCLFLKRIMAISWQARKSPFKMIKNTTKQPWAECNQTILQFLLHITKCSSTNDKDRVTDRSLQKCYKVFRAQIYSVPPGFLSQLPGVFIWQIDRKGSLRKHLYLFCCNKWVCMWKAYMGTKSLSITNSI